MYLSITCKCIIYKKKLNRKINKNQNLYFISNFFFSGLFTTYFYFLLHIYLKCIVWLVLFCLNKKCLPWACENVFLFTFVSAHKLAIIIALLIWQIVVLPYIIYIFFTHCTVKKTNFKGMVKGSVCLSVTRLKQKLKMLFAISHEPWYI